MYQNYNGGVIPRVEKSDYFTRKGADVHTEAHISLAQVDYMLWCNSNVSKNNQFMHYYQAALGGTIRVQGIYEDINLQIPPGTPSHTRLQTI